MRESAAQTLPLNVSGISDEAFVHHCYVRAFHRACHMQEAMIALSLLASGRTRESLWYEIAASGMEWRADPATVMRSQIAKLLRLDGRDFVRGAYRIALQRDADPEGMEVYLAQLHSGRPKQDLLKDILESEEARGLPSTPTLRTDLSMLSAREFAPNRPLSVADLRVLVKSDQSSFVDQAYRIILGRNPDPEGRHHYQARLASGRTKGQVIAEISRSQEARRRPRTFAGAIMLRLLRWRLPGIC